MPPYPRFKPKTNGAKEGLEKKFKYWENKDYDTEYSIAVAQAMNLCYQHLMGKREPTDDEIFSVFEKILKYKNDEKFRTTFRDYFEKKMNMKARDIEKEEQRLNEAGPGIEDFGGEGEQTNILI